MAFNSENPRILKFKIKQLTEEIVQQQRYVNQLQKKLENLVYQRKQLELSINQQKKEIECLTKQEKKKEKYSKEKDISAKSRQQLVTKEKEVKKEQLFLPTSTKVLKKKHEENRKKVIRSKQSKPSTIPHQKTEDLVAVRQKVIEEALFSNRAEQTENPTKTLKFLIRKKTSLERKIRLLETLLNKEEAKIKKLNNILEKLETEKKG
ncbi:MAG: hypothetical protein N2606_00850 [Candidatus Omnitrophica bacterium]|nr:hypothetical protein [Candidatus Omnitrophota bacterium]